MSDDEHEWVRAFAPATVANVGCGFDIFGFAVSEPGDVVAARRRDEPGVVLSDVTGDDGRLPRDVERNTAGVAVLHLLAHVFDGVPSGGSGGRPGVELRLEKGMPLASGLGSSAASSVAAVVAVDAVLDLGLPRRVLLGAAVEGERIASGAAHADDAAPSLYGGFVLVRPGPEVTELPVPAGLSCAVVRPHVEVETGAARALLGHSIGLREGILQWGNAAALVAGLYRGDHELIASALHDAVVEPVRSPLVPGFAAVKEAALAAGALGCSLSGSGPSIFAVAADAGGARRCAAAMGEALEAAGIDYDVYVSAVGAAGARVLEEAA